MAVNGLIMLRRLPRAGFRCKPSATPAARSQAACLCSKRTRGDGRKYNAPFRITGAIKRVIVDVSGEQVEDYEAQMRIVLATQ